MRTPTLVIVVALMGCSSAWAEDPPCAALVSKAGPEFGECINAQIKANKQIYGWLMYESGDTSPEGIAATALRKNIFQVCTNASPAADKVLILSCVERAGRDLGLSESPP